MYFIEGVRVLVYTTLCECLLFVCLFHSRHEVSARDRDSPCQEAAVDSGYSAGEDDPEDR